MIETICFLVLLLASIIITAVVFFRKPKVDIPLEFEKVEKEIAQWLRSSIICARTEVTTADQSPNWEYPMKKRVNQQYGLAPLGLTASQRVWEIENIN